MGGFSDWKGVFREGERRDGGGAGFWRDVNVASWTDIF